MTSLLRQRERTWYWAIAIPLGALFSLRNESNNNSYNNFQRTGLRRELRWSLWKDFLNDESVMIMKKAVVARVMMLLFLFTGSWVKDVWSCSCRDRRPDGALSPTLEILLLYKDGTWPAEHKALKEALLQVGGNKSWLGPCHPATVSVCPYALCWTVFLSWDLKGIYSFTIRKGYTPYAILCPGKVYNLASHMHT